MFNFQNFEVSKFVYLGCNEPDVLKKMHNKAAYVFETK